MNAIDIKLIFILMLIGLLTGNSFAGIHNITTKLDRIIELLEAK